MWTELLGGQWSGRALLHSCWQEERRRALRGHGVAALPVLQPGSGPGEGSCGQHTRLCHRPRRGALRQDVLGRCGQGRGQLCNIQHSQSWLGEAVTAGPSLRTRPLRF